MLDSMAQLVRGILEYLVEHPEAKDTLSGIVDWWHPEETPPPSRREMEAALEVLVAEGLLKRRWVSPTEKIYGAVPHRQREIEAFLDRLRKGLLE
jgi:hypothetical protein